MAARPKAVFIFNHRYERNVPSLEEYYSPRYSKRSYIVPFADTGDPKIIPVYEAGWYFAGHIAQAAHGFIEEDVSHYLFVGDDLILNPRLTEGNIIQELNLPPGHGYIKSLMSVDENRYRWPWAADATASLTKFGNGFAYRSELPPEDEARAKFERMGFKFPYPMPRTLQELSFGVFGLARMSPWIYMLSLMVTGRRAPYPFLGGYSDFVIVPAEAIHKFVHYCGVFAAANVFAEVAVPTALALACDNVKTELVRGASFVGGKNLQYDAAAPMHGLELWDGDIPAFGEKLGYSFTRLIEEFPPDRTYVHPIKLSKWK